MDNEIKNKVTYVIYCINAFAALYNLAAKQAYAYLKRFKGIDFLHECYLTPTARFLNTIMK